MEVPGTGTTQPLDATTSIKDLAIMLHEFINYIGLKKAHIIGFSYATAISVELCSIWKGVESLSICCGVPGIPKSGKKATKKMIAASVIGPNEFAKTFVESLTVNNNNIPRNKAIIKATELNLKKMPKIKREIFFENSIRLLTYKASNVSFNIPSTVCVGEYDPYVTVKEAEFFAKSLKNCEYKIVKNADHLIHIQHPKEVAEILLSLPRKLIKMDTLSDK